MKSACTYSVAAFHVASLICTRFAVVTTLTRTRIIAEHLLRNYGMTEHCTSVRCVDIAVLELEALGEDLLVERIAEQRCDIHRDLIQYTDRLVALEKFVFILRKRHKRIDVL